MKFFLLILVAASFLIAGSPCFKYVHGHLNGRWISLYWHYPPSNWQKDVLIRNPGGVWWDAEYELVGDDSIKINSNYMVGWEYMIVLTRTDCE